MNESSLMQKAYQKAVVGSLVMIFAALARAEIVPNRERAEYHVYKSSAAPSTTVIFYEVRPSTSPSSPDIVSLDRAEATGSGSDTTPWLTTYTAPRSDPKRLLELRLEKNAAAEKVSHTLVPEGRWVRETGRSLHDSRATREKKYPVPPGAIYEDALPLLVREQAGVWLQPGESVQVNSAPPLMRLDEAQRPFLWDLIRVSKSKAPELLNGPFGKISTYRWDITSELGRRMTYWVEEAPPRRVLKWQEAKGQTAELVQSGQAQRNR